LALAFMLPSQPAHALTYAVTTLADSGAGSLRQAITSANGTPADDIIDFSVSGAIGLTSALPNLVTAATAGRLTINGAGAITVTRSSVSPFRIFRVNSGANVTLNDLTITDGNAGAGDGGGIYNSGILTVTNSTLSANTADLGGGILNNFGGTLMVTNSTLSGNTAGGAGGGIANLGGTLMVTNSTLSANTADFGGGIYNSGGTLTVTNSTLSGNTATVNGGGISNGGGTLTVAGSYLFANAAAVTGDGVYSANAGSVTNTCLVGNGDTAVINTNGTLTATGNWWGTSWGPNIPAAPASTGSLVSSGDSIGGTGIAASSVNVGIVTTPADYGTYSVSPIGNWLTVAPAGCGTCTAPSGVGAPRVCLIGRP